MESNAKRKSHKMIEQSNSHQCDLDKLYVQETERKIIEVVVEEEVTEKVIQKKTKLKAADNEAKQIGGQKEDQMKTELELTQKGQKKNALLG